MRRNAVIGVAIILLVGGWFALSRGDQTPHQPAVATPNAATGVGRATSGDLDLLAGEPIELERPDVSAAEIESVAETESRIALNSSEFSISGTVTDATTQAPVPDFAVSVVQLSEAGTIQGSATHAEHHDPQGRFSVAVKEPGRFLLMVRSAAFRMWMSERFELPDPGPAGPGREFDVQLDTGVRVTGRVVAHATGEPVAGAIVGTTRGQERLQLQRLEAGEKHVTIHAITDERGGFVLSGLIAEEQRLVASHANYAMGDALATPGSGEAVEIRLPVGAAIFGVVHGDDGQPLEGALVRGFPDGCHMGRSAMTDAEGAYRLLPMPPSPVEVVASPPAKQTEKTFGFTTEVKKVELAVNDMRLDFGPDSGHATWRGTIYDYDDKPLPSVLLALVTADSPTDDRISYRRERRARCDDQGNFELGKLVPGTTYRVEIRLDNDLTNVSWDDILIEEPGILERDVHIRSTVLAGRVVDAATGERPEGRGSVYAWMNDIARTHRSAQLDEAGHFVLRDLKPGVYDLQVGMEGRPTEVLRGIEIAAGEVRDDILVEVGGGGTLRILVEGFNPADRPLIHVDLRHEEGREWHFRARYNEAGQIEMERTLDPGLWAVHMAFTGLGSLARDVEILSGQTTELACGPGDVIPYGEPVTVAGHLSHADGRPVAGAFVFLYGLDAPQNGEMERRFRHGTTDTEGAFAIDGVYPGRWTVSARLDDGGEPEFADLIVPPNPTDPVPLELALAGGVIRGNFRDAATGAAFTKEGPTWWVFLHDLDSGELETELNGGHYGPTFELVGVAVGRYRLEVQATGYRKWTGPEFLLEKGLELDIGAIELDPAATLLLTVVDESGEPIEGCTLTLDGDQLPGYVARSDEPGSYRVRQLTAGPKVIAVEAVGFQKREVHVELHANEETQEQVVLQRK